MNIEQDTVPTVTVRITDDKGKVIDAASEPVVYLHGGYGNMLPKLEAALAGHAPGDKLQVDCDAGEAFGLRDETLVRSIDKADFPAGVKVGGQLEGRDDNGNAQVFTVLKIKGNQVMLDGNHPLAGQALRFSLHVLDVRAASAEEIAHRHVHGAHGHHH